MKIQKTSTPLSLSSLVTMAIVVTVLVTTVAMLVLVSQFSRDYARGEAEARFAQLAWQVQDILDRSMSERFIDLRLLAGRGAVRNTANLVRTRAVLEEMQRNVSDYGWIGLAAADGTVIAATGGELVGQSVAAQNWFRQGQQHEYLGDARAGQLVPAAASSATASATSVTTSAATSSAPTIPGRYLEIAMPVQNAAGAYGGVLGVHLDWSWARTLVDTLTATLSGRQRVDILIVRNDGLILLGPAAVEQTRIASAAFDASLRLASGAVSEQEANGERFITGFAHSGQNLDIPELKWTVLVRQSESEAMAGFNALQRQIVMVGSALGLLLMLVGLYLTRRLVAPLNALSAALEQRAAGVESHSLPLVRTYREIALLSTTLTAMVAREESYLKQVKSLNENLEQRVQDRTRRLQESAITLQQVLDRQREDRIRLEESENELRAILQNAHDAFIAIDENDIILEWNRAAEQLLGWSRAEALGQAMDQLIIPLDLRESHRRGMQYFLQHGTGPVINNRIEINALRSDGSELPVEMTVGHIQRRSGHLFIAFLHDISERLAMRESLEAMALTDMLTGLPNRRAFAQKLPEAMARALRGDHPMALLFMDIDGFKSINDQYGHEAGDELLRTFAQRLLHAVREVDTVARLAGDEFTVILEKIHAPADAVAVAEKILDVMREPFVLGAATVLVTSSIGISLFGPELQQEPNALLDSADQAMYAAKKAGKNCVRLFG